MNENNEIIDLNNTCNNTNCLDLSTLYNDETINIFSDASSNFGESTGLFCYGSIVVNKNTILDQFYAFKSDCTCSYDAELLGLRASLYAAVYYKKKYGSKIKRINIFSDSMSSILSIKGYKSLICKTIYNDNGSVSYKSFRKSTNKIPANENIVNECISLFKELIYMTYNNDLEMNLMFQPSHVYDKCNKHNINNKLLKCIEDFTKHNNLLSSPTIEYIGYISKFNSIVDETTRLYIYEYYVRNNNKIIASCPIRFNNPKTPLEYYDKRKEVVWNYAMWIPEANM